mmetsp:Transcript_13857/g.39344  ORF Transcript_13857/g.39344 Transcript_13857/m.39344 type:complete len:236 (+) Transcript_13857:2716-3423(+)
MREAALEAQFRLPVAPSHSLRAPSPEPQVPRVSPRARAAHAQGLRSQFEASYATQPLPQPGTRAGKTAHRAPVEVPLAQPGPWRAARRVLHARAPSWRAAAPKFRRAPGCWRARCRTGRARLQVALWLPLASCRDRPLVPSRPRFREQALLWPFQGSLEACCTPNCCSPKLAPFRASLAGSARARRRARMSGCAPLAWRAEARRAPTEARQTWTEARTLCSGSRLCCARRLPEPT